MKITEEMKSHLDEVRFKEKPIIGPEEMSIFESMSETEDLIENIQGRIYGFTMIPLEKRDELSKRLYEIRMELVDYSNKLASALITMGAFD